MDHPLTAYRRQKGLTLDALAERAGTSKSNLHRIERGEHGPSMPLMHRLVRATDGQVTIDDLIAAHPDTPKPECAA